jgi:hypothetical protein
MAAGSFSIMAAIARTTSAAALRSACGQPLKQLRSGAHWRPSSASRTCSLVTGSRRDALSFMSSTRMPPPPTTR